MHPTLRSTHAAVVLLGLSLLGIAGTASAHAWLLDSTPAAGSNVAESPPSITLRFTENVERDYTGGEVLNQSGARVDENRVVFYPGGRENEILLPIPPLPVGVYTVRWSTLSVDSHTAEGSFLFAVGNASLEGLETTVGGHTHEGTTLWVEGFARALFYAGIAGALGVPIFLLLVWGPIASDRPRTLWWLEISTGLTLSLVGAAAGLAVLQFLGDRTQHSLWDAASSTRTGRYLVFRSVALVGAAAAFAAALPRSRAGLRAVRPHLWTAAAAGLAAAVFTSISSHAASLGRAFDWPVLVDLAHIVAGSLWIGGLVGFVLVMPDADSRRAARLIARFSPLAMSAVALILATGIVASLLHLERVSDLWTSLYGRSILVKASLLTVLILFGAFNQFILQPRLARDAAHPRALRRSVFMETLLLAGALLAAGVLATSAPPSQDPDGDGSASYQLEHALEKTHVVVDIRPNPPTVGIQNITVTLHPVGSPDTIPQGTEVYLKFQRPNGTEPEDIHVMERTSAGTWFLHGGYFTEVGDWTLHVIMQRPDEYAKIPFVVPVR